MFVRTKRSVAIGLTFLLITGCSATDSLDSLRSVFYTSSTETLQSSIVSVSQIQYAFTQKNQHPEKLLIEVMNNATQTLDISIYSLTERKITQAIINARKRGVEVRIITDHSQSGGETQADRLNELIAAGIQVKENTHSGLMHQKITIADRTVVTTGSFNYSAAATKYNDEVLVVIHDELIAQYWSDSFEEMWTDESRFRGVVNK